MPLYAKRVCEGCGLKYSPTRANQKYCETACQNRAKQRRHNARKKEEQVLSLAGRVTGDDSADGRGSARRGPKYLSWVAQGWPTRIRTKSNPSGAMTVADVARLSGESHQNIHRWLAAWQEDQMVGRAQGNWDRDPDVTVALGDFAAFRERYFLDEWGNPYVTEPYHQKWIDSLLDAMEHGGRRLILSPPRHGKTQLLIHFCVWRIILNPNIRIVWIGLNEANAKEAVGAVLDILENDDTLVRDVLGPGGTFKPGARSGRGWSSEKFITATRTGTGIKSPTMRAVGKQGRLLSKDADLIIADDIQDQEAYESPDSRAKDVRWWNNAVSSRKEAHTALLCIGSRQHHEDLYGRIINNAQWDHIVETAHSFACDKPLHPMLLGARHEADCDVCAEHVDCMLWPTKRPMSYIQDQRAAAEDDELFEMVYFNRTRPAGEAYVTREHLQNCHDLERSIGHIPPGTRLIAGLDPALKGHQAAVLWAWHPDTHVRYLVDLDNRKAGGLPGMREILEQWHTQHGCAEWVFEDNGAQEAYFQDRDFLEYTSRHGIAVHKQTMTAQTKWNPHYGLTKQFSYFRADPPLINFPWGDEDTRAKVRVYEEQILRYEPAVGRTTVAHFKSDVVMAGFIPETRIRFWKRDQQTQAHTNYRQTAYARPVADTYRKVAV